jgi:sugar phosphate isomerase/epimerase
VPEFEALASRLGIQILFDCTDILDAIDFAVGNGFGVLEINLGNIRFGEQLRHSRERWKIRRYAEKAGIRLAVHALEGPSFFIPSERVRRVAVTELKQTLNQAAGIGAENVIMHLGFDMHYGYGGGNRYTHEEFPDYYQAALAEVLSELKAYARDRARLCVENVGGFRYLPSKRVLRQLIGGSLGLCFDVGHIAILPADKRKQELDFFRRFGSAVYHAHIHHNNGAKDQHLPLGKGTVDIRAELEFLLDSRALLVFETRPKAAAVASREYFRHRLLPRLGSKHKG